MDWNRVIPISMAVIYLAIGLYVFVSEPSKDTGLILFFVLIFIAAALSMIWSDIGFSGTWGDFSHGKWRYTPPSLVRLSGWVLLFFPVWLPLIVLLIRWMG